MLIFYIYSIFICNPIFEGSFIRCAGILLSLICLLAGKTTSSHMLRVTVFLSVIFVNSLIILPILIAASNTRLNRRINRGLSCLCLLTNWNRLVLWSSTLTIFFVCSKITLIKILNISDKNKIYTRCVFVFSKLNKHYLFITTIC